jgi:hypothetical protein
VPGIRYVPLRAEWSRGGEDLHRAVAIEAVRWGSQRMGFDDPAIDEGGHAR